MELLARFLIGGTVVSLFSLLGDVFKPKSFAGLFGGAPSVALASLGLAFSLHGPEYVALEGRSMILGAFGLFVYCRLVAGCTMRKSWSVLPTTLLVLPAWFVVSLGLWWILLGKT